MPMAKEQAQLQNRANLRQYNYDMKQFEAQRADLERETELTNKVQDATFEYQQELRNIERLSIFCLLYTSPSPRDRQKSRMPSSA